MDSENSLDVEVFDVPPKPPDLSYPVVNLVSESSSDEEGLDVPAKSSYPVVNLVSESSSDEEGLDVPAKSSYPVVNVDTESSSDVEVFVVPAEIYIISSDDDSVAEVVPGPEVVPEPEVSQNMKMLPKPEVVPDQEVPEQEVIPEQAVVCESPTMPKIMAVWSLPQDIKQSDSDNESLCQAWVQPHNTTVRKLRPKKRGTNLLRELLHVSDERTPQNRRTRSWDKRNLRSANKKIKCKKNSSCKYDSWD